MRSPRTAHLRSNLRGTLLAVSIVTLGLPLAACSSPGGSTGSTPPTPTPGTTATSEAAIPNACAILGTDQIEASTGIVTTGGKPDKSRSSATTSVCDWKPDGASSPTIDVLISFASDNALAASPAPGATPAPVASPNPSTAAASGPIAAQRAAVEAANGPATDVVVAGGTDAFILANGSIVGMNLQVTKKAVKYSYYIQVTYTSGDTADASLITKALAALVATSL